MTRKGILLAGGRGTRLYPTTIATNKHLLPVFDKPMIFYSLSLLMLAGIREILLITSGQSVERFRTLLGDGSRFGVDLHYGVQDQPLGLPDAFRVGASFLSGAPSCMVLGDTFLHGRGLVQLLHDWAGEGPGARILCFRVDDQRRYGIATFGPDGTILALEEKPASRRGGWAIPGLYCFDRDAPERAAALRPSARGELEILDLCHAYWAEGALSASRIGRGLVWMDLGLPEDLLMAANYVHVLDRRQRLKVGCLEEIGWRSGWIDDAGMIAAADAFAGTEYGDYLRAIVAEER